MQRFMKKVLVLLVILINCTIPRLTLAYIEETDSILNDKENVIYMIGSAYNRLTDAKITLNVDSYRIYKIDLNDNSKSTFYEVDKRGMDRLLISPDNNYISVTRYEKDLKTEILIVDRKLRSRAQSISVPEGILSYVWSPDSKQIAYMSGVYKEGGAIDSKGIWVYDLEKNEKKKVADAARSI